MLIGAMVGGASLLLQSDANKVQPADITRQIAFEMTLDDHCGLFGL
jgi:hypothetical protein